LQSQPDRLILEKKELIHNATFVYSDHGHSKINKPRENDAKTRRSVYGTWIKKDWKSHFEYKLYGINRQGLSADQ
jgi:hypothetical protein